MTIKHKFKLSGVGKALPKKCVTSTDIEQKLHLPSGWVQKYLGVETRYRAIAETNTSLAVDALAAALQNAGLHYSDLDIIVAASATFDYILPNRSCLIKAAIPELTHTHIPCVDINTVCTSFITALNYAALQLQEKSCNHVAIISSEIASNGLDPANPETYSLFGDAAAAVIVSKTHKNTGSTSFLHRTYSDGIMDTIIEGGGNINHPKNIAYAPRLFSFNMSGTKLLKKVSKYLPVFMNDLLLASNTTLQTIDVIIPHQASKSGLKILADYTTEKQYVANEIATYGNCIAASIPLALANAVLAGKIKQGDLCLLIGTAAGLSIVGMTLVYGNL